jgi:hypothetical protein
VGIAETEGRIPRMPEDETFVVKTAAIADARDTVNRFISRGGFTGRLESVEGVGRSTPPSEDEILKMSNSLASAVREDPLAFGILGEIRDELQIREQLADAVGAIQKDGRNAILTEPQRSALEAIVLLTGRPVLFIKNDNFELPTGAWEILAPYRPEICDVVKSVGRIGISIDYGTPYAGTGFVVGENLIMTNHHVIKDFVWRKSGQWVLDPGCKMVIDFKQEFGVADKVEFPIDSVVWDGVCNNIDLALLKLDVSTTVGHPVPPPLRLQKDPGYTNVGNNVYVVGYPAADPTRNDPNEMQRIFGSVYEKKRLAPGRISSIYGEKGLLSHDCSTLGGNSGSCVMDLSTNSVVGLHFEGNYLVSNTAIVLASLAADPSFAADPSCTALNWQEGRDV